MASFNQLRHQAHAAATSGGTAAVTLLAHIVEELCQKCEVLERLATNARAQAPRPKRATASNPPSGRPQDPIFTSRSSISCGPGSFWRAARRTSRRSQTSRLTR